MVERKIFQIIICVMWVTNGLSVHYFFLHSLLTCHWVANLPALGVFRNQETELTQQISHWAQGQPGIKYLERLRVTLI